MSAKPSYEELEKRVKELEIKAQENQSIHDLFRSAPHGIFLIDLSGKVLYANVNGARRLGKEPEEVVGTTLIQYFPPDIAETRRLKGIEALRTGSPQILEDRVEDRWYFSTVFPIKDENGNQTGLAIYSEDITDRKQAEDTLRESEDKYKLVAEHSADVIYKIDIATEQYTYISPSIQKLLGYTVEEGLSLSARDSLTAESYIRQREGLIEALSDNRTTPAILELEAVHKDGHTVPVEVHVNFVFDEQGNRVEIVGVVRDIAERKRTHEQLRQSEEKYRDILETIEEGYYETDIAGNFVFFNESFLNISGYSKDELAGTNYRQHTDPKDIQRVYETFNKVYDTGEPVERLDWEIMKKDGSIRHIEVSVSLRRDSEGHRVGFCGIVRDVTEIKKAEEALRETKDNLSKAQEIAHIGNWSRDLDLNRGEWSDEMYRIFNLTPEGPAAPPFENFLTRVHPADRERVISVFREAIEKKGSFDFEFRIIPAEVEEKIIRNCGEVVCDETGIPVRIFGTAQDITENRRLQAQLQEAKKMEAIATLAGGVAHLFNNALTSITGHAGLFEMEYPQDEKIMKYAEAMKQSALRMAHLTSQLLSYARGGQYYPQILSLGDFIRETLPLIQPSINPLIHVETDLALDTYNAKVDRTQMQMVLSDIVANSNEAIDGPGRIRISARNMELDMEFIKDHPGLRPGPYVCLSIEDDGKGMDEETKNRIFEPFFTTHFIGRGLGMASVYGIVANHNGAITVDSELGRGSVVKIYLPAIEVEEKAVSKPKVDLARSEGTILVIEDEEMVMNLTRDVLERLGYRILEARTGKEAVGIARTFDGQIDLALLDIKLPDIPGDKVYPLIMEARPDLKVIVCSGYSIDGPAHEILDAGAQGFIQKPFMVSTLGEKLKEVLGGS